jgi:TRAP transporter 4TM/12TM fusion protein
MAEAKAQGPDLDQAAPDEVPTRRVTGKIALLISALTLVFSGFQIYANNIGIVMSMKHGAIFLAFTLSLIFLLYPATGKGRADIPWYDWLLSALGAYVGLFLVVQFDSFVERNLQPSKLELYTGGLAVLLVIEATRRAVGKWMALIPVAFMAYALYGNYIPGPLGHFGFTTERLIIRMYMVDEGLFGVTLQVAITYIFMFILFGAFLQRSGVGQFFNDLAFSISGGSIGGPAKVAVISSGLMGTISGSAVANVATTGAFTIPLMKKTGFSSTFAGATEAAASTGGGIMPPIMGAASFLIAEFLGIGYLRVMMAAILPALLYYLSVFAAVHLEAMRLGLKGLPKEELPRTLDVLKKSYLMAPLFIIVGTMFMGYTPLQSAFFGLISIVGLSFLGKFFLGGFPGEGGLASRLGDKLVSTVALQFREIIDALQIGAKSALSVGIACAAAGIIVGVTVITGVGQVITLNILNLSGGSLFAAMVMIAIACVVLSMGLPVTAAYIVVASIAAPGLERMGALALSAHFFVFWWANLSNLTPPVAMASYTAAGLAGASPSDVGWKGLRLTLPGFFLPFIMVYAPEMLLEGATFPAILWPIATSVVGVLTLALGAAGFYKGQMNWLERIPYLICSLLLIDPGAITDTIGFGLLILGIALSFFRIRRSAAEVVYPGSLAAAGKQTEGE